jgi:hypothetical protein
VLACRTSSRYGTFPGSLICGFLMNTCLPGPRPVLTPSLHSSLSFSASESLPGSLCAPSSSFPSPPALLRFLVCPRFPPRRLAVEESALGGSGAWSESESAASAEPWSKYLLCLAVALADLRLGLGLRLRLRLRLGEGESGLRFLDGDLAVDILADKRRLGALAAIAGAGAAREDRRGMDGID